MRPESSVSPGLGTRGLLLSISASLADGVGQFACVSPPRFNQNLANLCPLLWRERGRKL